MKLTKYIRDAFVSSALKDVPQEDYLEQIRKIVHDTAVANLPPAVAKIYQDPNMKGYINTGYTYAFGISLCVPSPDGHGRVTVDFPPKIQEKLGELSDKHTKQVEVFSNLEYKLRTVAYGCNTRKQLLERLPEFEKYLPNETAVSTNLPAITNLVTDFVKAGWPKKANKTASTAT